MIRQVARQFRNEALLSQRISHARRRAAKILHLEVIMTLDGRSVSTRQTREPLMRQESVCGIGRVSESILHDLRNPLAAIYGAAEMLVNADLPPDHIKRLAG